MDSPSPTSSSGSSHFSLFRNGPQNNEYIKSNKNIILSYLDGSNSFQQGHLGDNDTFLVGTIHLNYTKPCQIKSVYLHFKGIEKTSWQRSQARAKNIYSGEHTLVDQTNKVWEAFDDAEEVTMLDIPFKVQLPYNLPDTVTTDIGSVRYVLRATVNTKSLIGATQSVKLHCQLKRTITLDVQHLPPFKLCGQTPSGIDYTFLLPPNKIFNVGTYVSIPMKLRFLHPNVGVERVEVCLRTAMDFQSTTQGETRHIDQKIIGIIVSRAELSYSQPTMTSQYYGECTHTLNLFIPKNVQPTHQGRFISIAHFININFFLWGFESDYHVEESVRIAHIIEKYPSNVTQSPQLQQIQQPLNTLNLSNLSNISIVPYTTIPSTTPNAPITPQITPPLPPKHVPTSPPMTQLHVQQYPYMNEGGHVPIEATYYQYSPKPERKPLPEHPKTFEKTFEKPCVDKPFDGYNTPQQILNYNNVTAAYYNINQNSNLYYKPENTDTRRDSGTSTPLKDFETNSNSSQVDIANGNTPYPTHLSPPPYRQVARQQEYK